LGSIFIDSWFAFLALAMREPGIKGSTKPAEIEAKKEITMGGRSSDATEALPHT